MKNVNDWSSKMSTTIRTIERRPIRKPERLVVQPFNRNLVGEWQQRGPETISGHAFRKLRFALAPRQSVIVAEAIG
jgi:hypothetical protein